MPPQAEPAGHRGAGGDAEGGDASFLRLGSLFRSDTGAREGLELRLRPVVFYSLAYHRVQHLFWRDIDCTCVVRPRCPVLYNPGGILLSDIQKIVLTNLEYFYLRVPSVAA